MAVQHVQQAFRLLLEGVKCLNEAIRNKSCIGHVRIHERFILHPFVNEFSHHSEAVNGVLDFRERVIEEMAEPSANHRAASHLPHDLATGTATRNERA